MPNPSHGFDPALFHEDGLLAQRVTEHRTEAEVTVEARPVTFTQAAGLLLWNNPEAYLALEVTRAEPEGEPQRGQQWGGAAGGRTVLSLVERDEDGVRQVAVVDVPVDRPVDVQVDRPVDGPVGGPVTLGVTVEGARRPFLVPARGGADGDRAGAGLQPAVRRPRLPAAVHRGPGGDPRQGPRGRGVHS
ncbi:beta-xylosidase family glycoside hydrolase [Streptomyces massasporeus]|uniref:beta-xylosidase family glycoside hydrolase n=1 Tax=Streptomyces massasporeus TaxID=67324 RepID=UPI0036FAF0D1